MELRPEDEEEYDSTQEVEYRGDFKPELAQLLTQLRMQQGAGWGSRRRVHHPGGSFRSYLKIARSWTCRRSRETSSPAESLPTIS